ncbi:hypothetical protein EG329_011265 [Mollisiaceae sp. DMI_Dod_QoI]|nr:hypothetical protein EG329_011265 [Helotiales sp. DMI_Dod_QoI]
MSTFSPVPRKPETRKLKLANFSVLKMTTKFIYYFLVERAYIIRRSSKPRLKDTLYLFNSFGMLIPYCVVIALNFYFRFAVYENHTCRIGMKRVAMIPLITFDILVNVYLTSLFLIPLRCKIPYFNHLSTNLTVVMALDGEPGWICLMCCNIDILFSVLVLHWITSKDNASTLPSLRSQHAVPISHSPHAACRSRNSTSSPSPFRSSLTNCNSNSPFEIEYLPSAPKRLIPRPPLNDIEAFDLGLREWGLGFGGSGGANGAVGVTTMVTAARGLGDGEGGEEVDQEVLRRIESLPPGVVSVETRTVQVLGEGDERIEMVGRERDGKGKEGEILEEVEEVGSEIESLDGVRSQDSREEGESDGGHGKSERQRESTEDLFRRE